MKKKDDIWLKCMHICAKYWGCHQMLARSYSIGNYQFPLCARCTGLLIGYFTESVFFLIDINFDILTSVMLVIPTFLDGMLQLLTSYESKNVIRLSTGYIAGIGILSFVIEVIKFLWGEI